MRLEPCRIVAFVAAMALPAAALADERDRLAEKLRLLERVIESQQDRLGDLEQRVQIADDESVEAARIAETKKLIREVLGDTEFRGQLVSPTLQAGFDKGFYIRSSDEDFELKIQLGTQFRYMGVNRQTDDPGLLGRQRRDDISGFEWERTRVTFGGHMFTKALTYKMQLDGDTDGGNVIDVLDLYFAYEYAKGHRIWWGHGKVPQGFQRLVSSFAQTVPGRSMASGVFDLGRSIGIAVAGKASLGEGLRLHYKAGVYNGVNNHQDDVRDVDTNLAVAVRAALEFGDYGKEQSDLRKDNSRLGAQLGGHFVYNNDNNDTRGAGQLFAVPDGVRAGRGGYGVVNATGTDFFQVGVDAGLKYQGFSLATEWFLRHVRNDWRRSAWILATNDARSTCQGGYVQLAYLIPNTQFEPVARAGGVWGLSDRAWEYSVGANYYIKGNSLKLSAYVTWTAESPTTSSGRQVALNDDMTLYRLQIQAATK